MDRYDIVANTFDVKLKSCFARSMKLGLYKVYDYYGLVTVFRTAGRRRSVAWRPYQPRAEFFSVVVNSVKDYCNPQELRTFLASLHFYTVDYSNTLTVEMTIMTRPECGVN